eukprot:5989511-Amphidinium_carterae.1
MEGRALVQSHLAVEVLEHLFWHEGNHLRLKHAYMSSGVSYESTPQRQHTRTSVSKTASFGSYHAGSPQRSWWKAE